MTGNGYVFQDEGRCKACGARLLWFLTPRSKRMPFDPEGVRRALRDAGVPPDTLASRYSISREAGREILLQHAHHAVCPAADRFRGKGDSTAGPRS